MQAFMTSHISHDYTPIGKLLQQMSKMYGIEASTMLAERGHGGLSLAHTALVFNLDADGTKCTIVTKRAGIKRQSMAELANDLERRNYVKRIDDPNDKRAQIFVFTKSGIKFASDAKEICKQLDKKYEKLLGIDATTKIRSSIA